MSNKKSRTQLVEELVGKEVLERLKQADPSSSNKYILWMAKQIAHQGYDEEDIVDVVSRYDRRSKKCKHQDIYQYIDARTLENELETLAPSKSERKDLRNLKEGVDYIKLLDKGKTRLYNVLTYPAMKNLGKNTDWCIQARSYTFDDYFRRNNVFVLINDNVDETHQYSKVCILTRRGQHDNNGNVFTGWDKFDRTFQWNRFSSREFYLDLLKATSAVDTVFEPTKKDLIFTYQGTEESLSDIIKCVTELGLIKKLCFSNNKQLIKAMKNDILKATSNSEGKIDYDKSCTKEFFEIMKDHFTYNSIISVIQGKALYSYDLDSLSKVLESLSDAEYTSMINGCSSISTRKVLLVRRPHCWKGINTENVSAGIASYLCKKFGAEAVTKGYLFFGKKGPCTGGYNRAGRWIYTSGDNSYTKLVKELKLTSKIISDLRKKTDLPAEFSNYLDKLEKKELNKKDKAAIKKALEIIAKAEKVKVDKLKPSQIKFYHSKAMV